MAFAAQWDAIDLAIKAFLLECLKRRKGAVKLHSFN